MYAGYTHFLREQILAPLHRYELDRSCGVFLLGESFVFELPADQHMRLIARKLIEKRKKEFTPHEGFSIPKTLHQIWPFEENLPDDFARTSLLLREQHPSFSHKIWRPSDFAPLLTATFGEDWEKLPPHLIRDLVAAAVLLQEGGVVVDFESECVQPIDTLLSLADCIVGFEPPLVRPRFQRRMFLSSALIASVPRHHFINTWFQKMAFRAKLFLQDPSLDPLFISQESLTSSVDADEKNQDRLLLVGPTYFAPINPAHITKAREQWDGLRKRSLSEKILQTLHLRMPVPFSSIDEATVCIHMHGGRQSRKCFEDTVTSKDGPPVS